MNSLIAARASQKQQKTGMSDVNDDFLLSVHMYATGTKNDTCKCFDNIKVHRGQRRLVLNPRQ